MTRSLRAICCWTLFVFLFLPPVPGYCDARSDAARQASLDSFHQQAKFLLETSIIGYTLIRHTPAGKIFSVHDLTGNAYFLFPTSAIAPELKIMLDESYLEGKFIKLNGLVVTWEDTQQPGTHNKKESGFFVDSGASYEWADPVYAEMRAAMELEKNKQETNRRNAQKKAELEAKRQKNDPSRAKELNAKIKELKEKGSLPKTPPEQGNPPPEE